MHNKYRNTTIMATSNLFPLLSTSDNQLPPTESNVTHRLRKGSGLGGDVRVDTVALPSSRSGLITASPRGSQVNGAQQYHANTNGSGAKRLSKPRGAYGLVSRVHQCIVEHTYILPACILIICLVVYVLDTSETNPLHCFIFLSYRLPQDDPSKPAHYGKGPRDIAFVSFYIVVLSFTREFIMQILLRPLARRTNLSLSKRTRFVEQLYTAIYFSVLGPVGMYIMGRTPVWYFNTRGMYEGFPHRSHEALFKFYYLFQAAYWAQQVVVLVLGLEKPRKDFKELVGHHVISLALIALSYRFHFTYIGIAVYTTHDISDFFLATSKVLNYLNSVLILPCFFVFMGMWIYLRHYINIIIIWSLFTEFRTVGPFDLNWETQQYKCWISQLVTISLLTSLQALNLFWLFYIVRIAYRFLINNTAEDDRSEDEDDEPAKIESQSISSKALS